MDLLRLMCLMLCTYLKPNHNDILNPYLIRHVIKYGAKIKAIAPPNISNISLLSRLNISIIAEAIIEMKMTEKIFFLFFILQLLLCLLCNLKVRNVYGHWVIIAVFGPLI